MASRIFHKKKLVQMTCNEGQRFEDYFVKFESAVRDLKSAGGQMDESDIVMQLLISLPSSFDNVVTALENLDEKELTIDRVKSRLLDEELKRQMKVTTNKDRSGSAFEAKKTFAKKTFAKKKKKVYCYGCVNVGHKKPDCPKKERSANAGAGSASHSNRNFSMISAMATEVTPNTASDDEVKFVVDSGCTDHIVSDVKLLVGVKKL